MILSTLDLAIILSVMALSLVIGILASRKAGKDSAQFFLSGRNMPWWLLGTSMVATTFSTDTPNLVTDIVRRHGVAGNWEWWALLLTGMLTVFVYAKLWRRSGLLTDISFYELRYSGKPAAFLRAFRAGYMVLVFGILAQAAITLAAIKIAGIMIGVQPLTVVLVGGGITALYSMSGGLRGVVWADLFQFGIAIFGSVAAAYVALTHPQVGGLDGLLGHANVVAKTALVPSFDDMDLAMSIFVLPLTVFWWSMWYGGSEPGGAAYIVQRILSAKDERHAMGATLFFQVVHYAVRPWPWIIVALASLIVFPDLESLAAAFPTAPPGHDLGYPAMLTFMPPGLLGIVVASLAAAYMSTISTQLNLMSSYVVNDLYGRFYRPEADERERVLVGRIATVLFVLLAGFVALQLQSALQVFRLLLQIGAGTGLVFLLRWFWWRVNAFSEIAAMATALTTAVYFNFVHEPLGFAPLRSWQILLTTVVLTTTTWLVVTLLTRPSDDRVLRRFYQKVRPGGPGWTVVRARAVEAGDALPEGGGWDVPIGLVCAGLGAIAVYSTLFSVGYWLYGRMGPALALTTLAVVAALVLARLWPRLEFAPPTALEELRRPPVDAE
ncbi:MAG: sodium:solute symporter family protein [Longimicrobiales bacterium]|nr:sodium:solute symporter family protein [Longimicrobiales bacterium]